MAEMRECPNCHEQINLEIDVHRDENNNLICNHCNGLIDND